MANSLPMSDLSLSDSPISLSSSKSVTIVDLPPELIRRCLELAIAEFDVSLWYCWKELYPILVASTLISRQFTQEARCLLWRNVLVRNDDQAEVLLQNPGWGQYSLYRMEVNGGVSFDVALKVLQATAGLRRLTLTGSTTVGGGREGTCWDYRILQTPSLKDLTILRLEFGSFEGDTDPTIFPFSLESLTFWGYSSSSPAPFSLFSSSTITSLAVDDDGEVDEADEVDFPILFRNVAPQLHFFRFDDPTSHKDGVLPGIIPFFHLCTSLFELFIECTVNQLASILLAVPSRLGIVTFYPPDHNNRSTSLAPLLGVLHSKSLSRLQEFIFGHISENAVEEMIGGTDTLTLLRGRGVEVKYQ